jgi:hypothetical protein
MTKFLLAVGLILAISVAAVVALTSTSPARAADCSANVSACIDLSKRKPNAVTRCQAAGQSCAKTDAFVGPFSGRNL